MSDLLLQEIDEELRQDRIKAFWKKHGLLIGIAATVFVAAIAGWRGYNAWQQSHAARDGDVLVSALKAINDKATPETQMQLAELGASGTKGAATLARFRLASVTAQLGDKKKAIDEFDRLAADGSLSRPLRDLASLRAAWLALETNDAEGVSQRIKPLAAETSAYRHTARELLALAAYQKKDLEEAARLFNAIVSDPVSPPEIRGRAETMAALLEADGISAPKTQKE